MSAKTLPPIPFAIIFPFPTGSGNSKIELPSDNDIQIGDFIVSRYSSSRWARYLRWENWHHAALISRIKPLTIIEAIGPNTIGQWEGPAEVRFDQSAGFGRSKDLEEIKFLRPIFPNPIREIAHWSIPRSERKILTEKKARERVVDYARLQVSQKENYNILATKWTEKRWYCSLIVYKSYSRTVTGMYLEDYGIIRAGVYVTPEDLIDSPRSEEYFSWQKGQPVNT